MITTIPAIINDDKLHTMGRRDNESDTESETEILYDIYNNIVDGATKDEIEGKESVDVNTSILFKELQILILPDYHSLTFVNHYKQSPLILLFHILSLNLNHHYPYFHYCAATFILNN